MCCIALHFTICVLYGQKLISRFHSILQPGPPVVSIPITLVVLLHHLRVNICKCIMPGTLPFLNRVLHNSQLCKELEQGRAYGSASVGEPRQRQSRYSQLCGLLPRHNYYRRVAPLCMIKQLATQPGARANTVHLIFTRRVEIRKC